jgi:hypothetical protein
MLHRHIVDVGHHLAREARPAAVDLAKSICVTMCQYFQVGDMFHCYIVDVGHHLAGEARPAADDLAKSICVTMGQYFQVGVTLLHC